MSEHIYIYANCVEEKNIILLIFMYNVISDFSAVTPASEGGLKFANALKVSVE